MHDMSIDETIMRRRSSYRISPSTSQPASFTPASLSGLKFWLRADTNVFQTTGGTTPATTAGHHVNYWGNKVAGAAYDLVAQNTQFGVLQFESSIPVIDFATIGEFQSAALSDGSPTDVSIHIVVKQAYLNNNYPVVKLCAAAGYSNMVTPIAGAGAYAFTHSVNTPYQDGSWGVFSFCLRSSTGKVDIYSDGVLVASMAATLQTAIDAVQVGWNGYGDYFGGRMAEIAVQYADGTADVGNFWTYAKARYAALMPTPVTSVVWIADSIMTTGYTGLTFDVPYKACLASGIAKYANLSIAGTGTPTWIPGAGNTIGISYLTALTLAAARSPTKKVMVVSFGRNDIGGGSLTVAQWFANTQTIANAAVAQGFKVVLGTIIPTGVLGPPDTIMTEATRATANNDLRGFANGTTIFCADTDTTVINTKPLSGTYSADGTHVNAAGAAILAPAYTTAINAAIA